jgi:hypothetical protein
VRLPRLPVEAVWWPPWTVTAPWRPRVVRGTDEWHNCSYGLVVPLSGAVIVYRMRYARDGEEHLHAWTRAHGWDGLFVAGCSVCVEILADHNETHEAP